MENRRERWATLPDATRQAPCLPVYPFIHPTWCRIFPQSLYSVSHVEEEFFLTLLLSLLQYTSSTTRNSHPVGCFNGSFMQGNLSVIWRKVKRFVAGFLKASIVQMAQICCQFPQDMVHYMRKLGASYPIGRESPYCFILPIPRRACNIDVCPIWLRNGSETASTGQ
jgi:hypothetical protein